MGLKNSGWDLNGNSDSSLSITINNCVKLS